MEDDRNFIARINMTYISKSGEISEFNIKFSARIFVLPARCTARGGRRGAMTCYATFELLQRLRFKNYEPANY